MAIDKPCNFMRCLNLEVFSFRTNELKNTGIKNIVKLIKALSINWYILSDRIGRSDGSNTSISVKT